MFSHKDNLSKMQVLYELSEFLEASVEKLLILEQNTIREINNKKASDSARLIKVKLVEAEEKCRNNNDPVYETRHEEEKANYLVKNEGPVPTPEKSNNSNVLPLICLNKEQNECSSGQTGDLVQSKGDSCPSVNNKRKLSESELDLKVNKHDSDISISCKKERTCNVTETVDTSFSAENFSTVLQALCNREEGSTAFINSIGIKPELKKPLTQEVPSCSVLTNSVEPETVPHCTLYILPEEKMYKAEVRFKVCHSYDEIEKSLGFAGTVEDLVLCKNKAIVTFSDAASLEALLTLGKSKLQEMKLNYVQILGNKIHSERMANVAKSPQVKNAQKGKRRKYLNKKT